ncbi:hypothetical protein ACFL9U_10850 [Thermodesulfobacteriota bacterium]
MENKGRSTFAFILLAIFIGLAIQAIYLGLESKDTPSKAVVEFAKAYYMLDHDMANRLCNELRSDEDADDVDQFVYRAAVEGNKRGFNQCFMRGKLYHIETRTTPEGDDKALVHFTAKRLTAINPVYAIVAQIFKIAETRDIDKEFNVVLEDGLWKVCDRDLFSVSG